MSNKVIKLSAEWCAPCKQYAPIFMGVMDDMESAGWEVSMLDVDTDEGKEVAGKYGVRGVPTTVVLEEDKDAVVQSGNLSESALRNLLGL